MNKGLLSKLQHGIAASGADRVIVITDSNVAEIEKDMISAISPADTIIVPAGEGSKSLQEVAVIVGRLGAAGATRRSLLLCVGGGMVTDLGGFVAAVFKRGIRHINVATTILGAVDASVGGKTGVDFEGLKNEIGAFHMPLAVYDDPESFESLPPEEVLSGWGEIVKMGYIAGDGMLEKVLACDPTGVEPEAVGELCDVAREKKQEVVAADPHEKGLRKILNLGHTAGHAFESLMLEKGTPAPHGVAVAHGLLVTLILSNMLQGLKSSEVSRYAGWLRSNYPPVQFTCKDYDDLWQGMLHDKKNTAEIPDTISFVLLKQPGDPSIDHPVTRSQLNEALDIYRELQGR